MKKVLSKQDLIDARKMINDLSNNYTYVFPEEWGKEEHPMSQYAQPIVDAGNGIYSKYLENDSIGYRMVKNEPGEPMFKSHLKLSLLDRGED